MAEPLGLGRRIQAALARPGLLFILRLLSRSYAGLIWDILSAAALYRPVLRLGLLRVGDSGTVL
jgi:hypothetical protein